MTSPENADIPKFYPIGPNTCGGYHSKGDGGEFAIPDYMHPDLGPDHTPLGSPAKVTLWFKSWDEAKQFMAFIDQARIRAQSTFSPGDPVEIRKQNDEIDEIVIRRGDVHIEQMSADGWFMGVDASDGSYWQFWFGSKNRKSHVEFRHTETVPASENAPALTSPGCGDEHGRHIPQTSPAPGYDSGSHSASGTSPVRPISRTISQIYGELDPEDCAMVDREWARMRGYILPSHGTSTLAIQPQCAPDREALVRAIQLSYARKDLEPTSATTLALYREDAEHAADAVLALTRPECGAKNGL